MDGVRKTSRYTVRKRSSWSGSSKETLGKARIGNVAEKYAV